MTDVTKRKPQYQWATAHLRAAPLPVHQCCCHAASTAQPRQQSLQRASTATTAPVPCLGRITNESFIKWECCSYLGSVCFKGQECLRANPPTKPQSTSFTRTVSSEGAVVAHTEAPAGEMGCPDYFFSHELLDISGKGVRGKRQSEFKSKLFISPDQNPGWKAK